MIDIVRGVIGVAACLGMAIFVHELGHFMWAKWTGVRVLKFSIGFGKFIFSWKWGETEYGLAWFPFGGYVQMHGDANDEEQQQSDADKGAGAASSDPNMAMAAALEASKREEEAAAQQAANPSATDASVGDKAKKAIQGMITASEQDTSALANKGFFAKLLIYSGGVVNNWITAILTIGLIYWIGFPTSKPMQPVIGQIGTEEIAAGVEIPLSVHDTILSVEGKAVANWEDFVKHSLEANEAGAKKVTASVRGPEENAAPRQVELQLEYPPAATGKGGKPGKDVSLFQVLSPRYPAYLEEVIPNKPADKAGIKRYDQVVSVNGQPIQYWEELATAIRANPKKELVLGVLREGQTLEIKVTPDEHPERPGVGQLGIIPGNYEREFHKESFGEAFAEAPGRTVGMTLLYIGELKKMFNRATAGKWRAVGDDLGGPVMIAQLSYRSAKRGMVDFLRLFFAINIALAVFNLIPIPVLDGSLIAFAAFEAIFKRPVPAAIHVPLMYAGLGFILLMAVVVTINDVFKIWG